MRIIKFFMLTLLVIVSFVLTSCSETPTKTEPATVDYLGYYERNWVKDGIGHRIGIEFMENNKVELYRWYNIPITSEPSTTHFSGAWQFSSSEIYLLHAGEAPTDLEIHGIRHILIVNGEYVPFFTITYTNKSWWLSQYISENFNHLQLRKTQKPAILN
jgi:hypothetical protein